MTTKGDHMTTTLPTNLTAPTAWGHLRFLDHMLGVDDLPGAADLLGSIAESFRNHEHADDCSRATAGLLEELIRLMRTADAELTAIEKGA